MSVGGLVSGASNGSRRRRHFDVVVVAAAWRQNVTTDVKLNAARNTVTAKNKNAHALSYTPVYR